jgi:hypothetical protein
VFEIRMLRKTLAREKEGVIEGSKILHNEELHNFYSSPNTVNVKVKGKGKVVPVL